MSRESAKTSETSSLELQHDVRPCRVQPGDIWQLGRHKLACLNSLQVQTPYRVLGEAIGQVAMVFADPPYGINLLQGKRSSLGRSKIRYDPVIGDEDTTTAIRARTLYHALWPDALHIWWGANNYIEAVTSSRCWIAWDKERRLRDFADAELAWTNARGLVRVFRHRWNGADRASERGRRFHPTQKPVALVAWCFERFGHAGDIIFDPFAGSGPSILAAEALTDGRTVYACEISPGYCETVLQRFEAQTGQQAVLLERAGTAATQAGEERKSNS